MATRVSELKDGVKYKTEREGIEYTFTSHTNTVGFEEDEVQYAIRKYGNYWQIHVYDKKNYDYWDYLTEPEPTKVRPPWRGGRRKSRKPRRKHSRRHTRHH